MAADSNLQIISKCVDSKGVMRSGRICIVIRGLRREFWRAWHLGLLKTLKMKGNKTYAKYIVKEYLKGRRKPRECDLEETERMGRNDQQCQRLTEIVKVKTEIPIELNTEMS